MKLFAIAVMVCGPAFGFTTPPADAPPFEYVDSFEENDEACRLYRPRWARDLTRQECHELKSALAAPIVGPGARFECVPIDTE